jgi:hypothetical protein
LENMLRINENKSEVYKGKPVSVVVVFSHPHN